MVDANVIAAVVAEWTGIPVGRMVRDEVQSVLGLAQKAVFYLENEDGDAFTVLWDPVSGRTNVFSGREEDL